MVELKTQAAVAAEAYSKHTITGVVVGTPHVSSWMLGAGPTSPRWAPRWTRVIAAEALIITGDGPDLIFRGGPVGGTAKVRWAADSEVDYLAKKLIAGPHSDIGLGVDWCPEVARADMEAHIAELARWGESDAAITQFRTVLAGDFDSHFDWLRLMGEHVTDPGEYRFGRRVASCVFEARAVCRRLVQLFDAEGAAA